MAHRPSRAGQAYDRRLAERIASAMPLARFPEQKRQEIAHAVAQPNPPERWLTLGGSGPRPLAYIESRAWYEWHWQRGINPEEARPPIPASTRAIVIERDAGICQICMTPVEPADVHLDHIKPWSKGGHHLAANLQVTHAACNLRKAARY